MSKRNFSQSPNGSLRALFCFAFLMMAVNGRASNLTWVELDTNAREAALGGCGVALDTGADSSAINPAWLGRLNGIDLYAMHNEWIGDTRFEHLSFGLPVVPGFGCALLLDYAGLGSVQGTRLGTDGYVYPTDDYKFSGYRLGAGMGWRLGSFGIGGSCSGLSENNAGSREGASVWNIGALYQKDQGLLTLGLNVNNVLTGEETDEQSIQVRPGVAIHFVDQNKVGFLFTTEGAYREENPKFTYKVGGEVVTRSNISFRAGWRFFADDSELGGSGRGFTCGLGVQEKQFQIDYALNYVGVFKLAHRVSLCVTLPSKNGDQAVQSKKKKGGETKTNAPQTNAPSPGLLKALCGTWHGTFDLENGTNEVILFLGQRDGKIVGQMFYLGYVGGKELIPGDGLYDWNKKSGELSDCDVSAYGKFNFTRLVLPSDPSKTSFQSVISDDGMGISGVLHHSIGSADYFGKINLTKVSDVEEPLGD
jgi:hypothetical protein